MLTVPLTLMLRCGTCQRVSRKQKWLRTTPILYSTKCLKWSWKCVIAMTSQHSHLSSSTYLIKIMRFSRKVMTFSRGALFTPVNVPSSSQSNWFAPNTRRRCASIVKTGGKIKRFQKCLDGTLFILLLESLSRARFSFHFRWLLTTTIIILQLTLWTSLVE